MADLLATQNHKTAGQGLTFGADFRHDVHTNDVDLQITDENASLEGFGFVIRAADSDGINADLAFDGNFELTFVKEHSSSGELGAIVFNTEDGAGHFNLKTASGKDILLTYASNKDRSAVLINGPAFVWGTPPTPVFQATFTTESRDFIVDGFKRALSVAQSHATVTINAEQDIILQNVTGDAIYVDESQPLSDDTDNSTVLLTAKRKIHLQAKEGASGTNGIWEGHATGDITLNAPQIKIDNFDTGIKTQTMLYSISEPGMFHERFEKGGIYLLANTTDISATKIGIDMLNGHEVRIENTEEQAARLVTLTSQGIGISAIQDDDLKLQSESLVSIRAAQIVLSGVEAAVRATGTNTRVHLEGVLDVNGNLEAQKASGYDNGGQIHLHYLGTQSTLDGDITSADSGEVQIISDDAERAITVTGNLSTSRSSFLKKYGSISLDLGKGSLTGGVTDEALKSVLAVNQENAGTNLTFGNGAVWNATANSFITTVNSAENSAIRMHSPTSAGSRTNNFDSDFIFVKNLQAENAPLTVYMNLNHDDHTKSDMLFAQNGSGEVRVLLEKQLDEATLEKIQQGEDLRFATVGKDASGLTFTAAAVVDQGVNNIEYNVEQKDYDVNDVENADYNSQLVGSSFQNFDDQKFAEGSNWVITAERNSGTSEGGDAILDMSRANYANAVFQMDTLRQRRGEARFQTGADDGLWIRTRHDRTGISGAFRSKLTMFELGYDYRKTVDEGEHRVGAALDYMDGEADYHGLNGTGEMDRWGLWLYDTWIKDDGTYADFVFKWGHLKNDFDIRTKASGTRVNGDYSNDVFSFSGEFGRKFSNDENWFMEPQAQLQYAYVTDADYRTNQGTKVELDSISSLIARAGLVFGKDVGEEKDWSLWLKADVLHEFLGKQNIKAVDATGTLDETFRNEGTWFDVGFGFSGRLGKSGLIHLDVDKEIGNNRTSSYRISGGLSYLF